MLIFILLAAAEPTPQVSSAPRALMLSPESRRVAIDERVPWSRPLKTAGIALTVSGGGVVVIGLFALLFDSMATEVVGAIVGVSTSGEPPAGPGRIVGYALIGTGTIVAVGGITSIIIAAVARRNANATLSLEPAPSGVGVRF